MASERIGSGSIRNSLGSKFVLSTAMLALCLGSVTVPAAYAQKADKPARRIVLNVKPDYPVSLRAAHVGGLVRLNVTVSANGNVTRIELLGGNPIFAESATKAVTKWKFVPAAAETTEEVEVRFNPDSPSTH